AYENGESQAAEEILNKALKELSEIVETRKLLLIEAQHALANIYRSEGRYIEAAPLYRWALAMAEASFGPNHADLIPLLADLAIFYRLQGRTDEEKDINDRITGIDKSNPGRDLFAQAESGVVDFKAKAS